MTWVYKKLFWMHLYYLLLSTGSLCLSNGDKKNDDNISLNFEAEGAGIVRGHRLELPVSSMLAKKYSLLQEFGFWGINRNLMMIF